MAPRTILSVLVPQAQNPLSLSGTGSRERQQQFLSGSAIHICYQEAAEAGCPTRMSQPHRLTSRTFPIRLQWHIQLELLRIGRFRSVLACAATRAWSHREVRMVALCSVGKHRSVASVCLLSKLWSSKLRETDVLASAPCKIPFRIPHRTPQHPLEKNTPKHTLSPPQRCEPQPQ